MNDHSLQFWHCTSPHEAHQVERLPLDKPTVIGCIGEFRLRGGTIEKDGMTKDMPPNISPEGIRSAYASRLCSYLDGSGHTPGSCQLICLASQDRLPEQLEQDIVQYQADPQHYCTGEARRLARQLLGPEALPTESSARREEVARSGKRLATVTFLGFSYGSLFVQMVRNALDQEMQVQGYRPDEINDALKRVSALNLGPVCKVVPKEADFTQLFSVAMKDHKSFEEDETGRADRQGRKPPRFGSFTGPATVDHSEYVQYTPVGSALILRTHGRPDTLEIKLRQLDNPQVPVYPARSFLERHRRDPSPQWQTEDHSDRVSHSLNRYMNVPQSFLNGSGTVISYQTDPCAAVHRAFLHRALSASRRGDAERARLLEDALSDLDKMGDSHGFLHDQKEQYLLHSRDAERGR